jgi:hypothetical protein
MKNNLFIDNYLTPLTENENIEIQGGGLVNDLFHTVFDPIGYAVGRVQHFLTHPVNDAATNPAKLNSGTYYGR